MTTGTIRARWLEEVSTVLTDFQAVVEKRIQTKVKVEWNTRVDIVEPEVKILARLEQHMPYVIPAGHEKKGHLTDSKSVALEVVRQLWDQYKGDNKDLLDFQLWIKANVANATAELNNEEFAEVMRLKRNGSQKANS